MTEYPQYGEVHAMVYRDRVVHMIHALVEIAFDRGFSGASFACRRGKGTRAAAVALRAHMFRLSRPDGVRVWALASEEGS